MMEVQEIWWTIKKFLRKVFQNSLQKLLFKELRNLWVYWWMSGARSRKKHFNEAHPGQISTCAGTIEPGLPRDRDGKFSTGLLHHYPGSEPGLMLAMAKIHVSEVSTRRAEDENGITSQPGI